MLLSFYIFRDPLLKNGILDSLGVITFPILLGVLVHWLPIIIFLVLWIKLGFPIHGWDVYASEGSSLRQTGGILRYEDSIWYFCWHNQYLCGHSFLSWDELIRHHLSCAYNPSSVRNYNLPLNHNIRLRHDLFIVEYNRPAYHRFREFGDIIINPGN